MSARRALLAVVAVVFLAAPGTATGISQAGGDGIAVGGVEVTLSRQTVSTKLGSSFDFESTITNGTDAPLSDLIAHLDVIGRDPSVYVDPEDWSSERTKFLDPLVPGESVEVPWTVKAVTRGEVSIDVAVLSGTGVQRRLAISPPLDASIAEQRTLNSGGVLYLALGLPALLGAGILATRRRRRRR